MAKIKLPEMFERKIVASLVQWERGLLVLTKNTAMKAVGSQKMMENEKDLETSGCTFG